MSDSGSVSYTHLDVYKRQVTRFGLGRSPLRAMMPVSYTHLDVYKRQPEEIAAATPKGFFAKLFGG